MTADITGSHRIVIVGGSSGCTAPDGFVGEAATTRRDRTLTTT